MIRQFSILKPLGPFGGRNMICQSLGRLSTGSQQYLWNAQFRNRLGSLSSVRESKDYSTFSKGNLCKPNHSTQWSQRVALMTTSALVFTGFEDDDDKDPHGHTRSEKMLQLSRDQLDEELVRNRKSKGPVLGWLIKNVWNPLMTWVRLFQLLAIFLPVALIGIPVALKIVPKGYRHTWYRYLVFSIETAGPSFIKLGQWAASRSDIFPQELCDVMSQLHSNAKKHSISHTRKVVSESFGKPFHECFVKFDEEPLGIGAMGQVYRAYFKSDEYEGEVAVKVLHPNVEATVTRDLEIMMTLAKFINALPTMEWLSLPGEVSTFGTMMQSQLDLRLEAENLHIFNEQFKSDTNISFPKALLNVSTRQLLVEQLVSGVSMEKVLKYCQRTEFDKSIAKLGLDAFLKMLLLYNFIHSDLHAGNIFLTLDGQEQKLEQLKKAKSQDEWNSVWNSLTTHDNPHLWFIDAGLVTELNPANRANFVALFKAIATFDGYKAGELMVERSRTPNSVMDKEVFAMKTERLVSQVKKRTFALGSVGIGDLLSHMMEMVRSHHVRMESDFITVILSILLLEGIGRKLDPDLDIFKSALPVLRKVNQKRGLSGHGVSMDDALQMLKVWAVLETRQFINATVQDIYRSTGARFAKKKLSTNFTKFPSIGYLLTTKAYDFIDLVWRTGDEFHLSSKMKFGKSLIRNEIPEWSHSYIDYKGLKKLVKQAAVDLNGAAKEHDIDRGDITNDGEINGNSTGNLRRDSVPDAIDDSIIAPFFFAVDRNVEIVDKFYNSKFAEYTRRLRHVEQQCSLMWQQLTHDEADDTEKEEMTGMLLELRSHMRNLQWFAEVNKRGFTKILKKFDKKIGTRAQSHYLTNKILILGFSSGQEITDKIDVISKLLQDVAPHLSTPQAFVYDQSNSGLSSSKTDSQVSLSSPFDQLRNAIELDDSRAVSEIMEIIPLNTKQVVALTLKAIANNSDSVIPLLVEHHATQLSNGNLDINRRNIIHKAVINEGKRAAEVISSKKQIDLGVPSKNKSTLKITDYLKPESSRTKVLDSRTAQSIQVLIKAMTRRAPVSTLLMAVDLQLRTPAHYAVRYGLAATSQVLLALEPACIKFADSDDSTPLDLAVVNKQPVSLMEVLKFDPPKRPALLLTAARLNAAHVCQVLIDEGSYDVNFSLDSDTGVYGSSGETALHLAAKYNHLETVKLLISRKANLEVTENTFKWTPLFLAAVDGSEEIAQVLLDAGARADILDSSGWSAKEHAALRGHLKLAKQLPDPPLTPPKLGFQGSSLDKRRAADNTALKTFGHRYLEAEDESLVLVSLGSRDLRKKANHPIQLNTLPMSEAGKTELDTALSLVVSAAHSSSEPFPVDLPVPELGLATEPIPFFTKNLDKIQIVFDLVPTYSASSQSLARGVFIPPKLDKIEDLNKATQTVSILEASSLRVLGYVNFEILIVKPFVHPMNGLNVSSTYWRSLITTRVIGHRGLGKNTLAKSSLQLGENTVESFIQAANLGASYVEFDVQLTKDSVPVIYHDFLVGDSGFDIPMHSMTLDQFMNIQRPVRGRNEKSESANRSNAISPETEVVDFPKVDQNENTMGTSTTSAKPHVNGEQGSQAFVNHMKPRSYSVNQFNRSTEHDYAYDDALRRMQYSRDFQTKGFKGNVRGLHIQSKFATLEELFKSLPPGLGFNIECKYPMLDEAEAEEMDGTVIEINHFVNTILKVIYDNKKERDIILSSFNPDICILLSLKQPSIPVLFLTEAGSEPMYDIRASSLQEAIRFARRFNLLGIVSGASPLIMCPRLIRAVKESGLVCFTYGVANNVPENARVQLKAGVDAVIVDSVLAIRKELTDAAGETNPNDILVREVSNAIKQAGMNREENAANNE